MATGLAVTWAGADVFRPWAWVRSNLDALCGQTVTTRRIMDEHGQLARRGEFEAGHLLFVGVIGPTAQLSRDVRDPIVNGDELGRWNPLCERGWVKSVGDALCLYL